jgi:DNA polymerase-3 subunit beta
MRVTFDTKDFAERLALINKTLGKVIIPALEGVLVKADADAPLLWLRGADLETEIQTQIFAEVEQPGTAVLPRKILAEMARTWPEDKVTLEVNQQELRAVLTCGEARLELSTYDPEEFPAPLAGTEEAIFYNVPIGVLTKVAKQVAVAVAKSNAFGAFSGILWEDRGDGHVTVVATDTYRMAWIETQVEREAGQAVKAIIPPQVISTAAAVEAWGNQERVIPCYLSDSHVDYVLEGGATWITSRLIGGAYPDWRQVVERDFATEVQCASNELIETVERAALLANQESSKALANLVNLELAGNHVTVNSQASGIGTFSDTAPAEIEGRECSLTFNVKYLLDGLKIFRGQDMRLRISRDQLQMIIEPINENGVHYLALPVRGD